MAKTTKGRAGQVINARITYYTISGTTASGVQTHMQFKDRGVVQFHTAACSLWIPFGTIFRFPNGFEVECQDRGSGLNKEDWIDVWAPTDSWGKNQIAARFGSRCDVTIMRWGKP